MSDAAEAQSHRSAYHEQWQLGFASLRFQKRIEEEFRFLSLRTRVGQLRAALGLAMVAVLALLLADLSFEQSVFEPRTALRRALLIEIILAMVLTFTFAERLLRYLPAASDGAAGACGLAVLVVRPGGIAGDALFPSCFIVTVYVYFLLGLRWLPAVATGGALLAGFTLNALLHAAGLAGSVNAVILLGAVNAVGAWGLYDLEFNRRKNFLKSKMLNILVERDPLTGLSNRKALDGILGEAWKQCRADEKSIAVAIVDIDHFKSYNDTYGHQAGDRCLARIARQLERASRRPRDAVGRYGGEEFLIVLPEATEYYALVLLDSIREHIQELALEHSAADCGAVTVSIGVAFCKPWAEPIEARELVHVADQALYKAKSEGRNRVVLGVRDSSRGATERNFGDKVSIAFTSPV